MGLTFWVTTMVIVATPGTGVLYTVAAGLSRGRRAGVIAAVGCTLGIVPHLLAAVTGLAAVLHASGVAFRTVQYLGVGYLLLMAWTTVRDRTLLTVTPSGPEPDRRLRADHHPLPDHPAPDHPAPDHPAPDHPVPEQRRPAWRVIVSGVLINLLNPKLTLFFVAFLPQFVQTGRPDSAVRMLQLGGVFMAVTLVVFAGYGIFAAAVRRHVIDRPALLTWLRRLFAGSYAAMAGRLALTPR